MVLKMIDPEERQKYAKEILEKKKYEVEKFLGQGAFGVTFKCINPKGKTVAAKVTFGNFDSKDVKAEIKAAKELAAMKPLNIDRYKAFVPTNKLPIIKKTLGHYNKYLNRPKFKASFNLEGEKEIVAIFEAPLAISDLSSSPIWDKIDIKDRHIKFEYIKKLGRQVAKALRILHNRDEVHLDVKPSNMLLIEKGNGRKAFQLADFGLMRHLVKNQEDRVQKTETGTYKFTYKVADAAAGDRRYKAPELNPNNNEECTIQDLKSADIFALGWSLLEIYSEKIGLSDGNITDYMYEPQKMNNIELPPGEKDFIKLLGKMCAEEPNERPTAYEVWKSPGLRNCKLLEGYEKKPSK